MAEIINSNHGMFEWERNDMIGVGGMELLLNCGRSFVCFSFVKGFDN